MMGLQGPWVQFPNTGIDQQHHRVTQQIYTGLNCIYGDVRLSPHKSKIQRCNKISSVCYKAF